LRMDQYGDVAVFSWYGADRDFANLSQTFSDLAESVKCQHWWARRMEERGAGTSQGEHRSTESLLRSSAGAPVRWQAKENGATFELRANQGHSFGLFLDQKLNRRWVRDNSSRKEVLNLFSYTGGFSVAALCGGATQVTSVDVSRSYGEWTSGNIARNVEPERHRFYKMDAREFVSWAHKKGKKYDLIVIDPPSFGRSDFGVFRIEEHLENLVRAAAELLYESGHLLICTNYENWDPDTFNSLAAEWLPQMTVLHLDSFGDYEAPGEPAILKSALLTKN